MSKDQVLYEVSLEIIQDEHGLYVRSADVPGLHLHGRDLRTMRPTIKTAIERLYRDNRNELVEVVWISEARWFSQSATFADRLGIRSVADCCRAYQDFCVRGIS